jgi:predicted MFS family arabinose efflux permease
VVRQTTFLQLFLSPGAKTLANTISEEPQASKPASASGIGLRQYAILVAAGAFATTFAQQKAMIGTYPTLFWLKNHFGFTASQVATFWLWTAFAWNLKPLAGVLTDAIPLFGTRRRHYMMLGSALAGICWIMMAVTKDNYLLFFSFSIAMNVTIVFASTVMGGLMVEAGQAFAAPGRISSLRQAVQTIAGMLAPLIGGQLATRWYGWTAGIAATSLIALAAITFFVLRESSNKQADGQRTVQVLDDADDLPPLSLPARIALGIVFAMVAVGAAFMLTFKETQSIGKSILIMQALIALMAAFIPMRVHNPVLVNAQRQLQRIFRSPVLGAAALMLFLVYVVPGIGTALTYRQKDVLHFNEGFIGSLDSWAYAFGFLATLFYAKFCRKWNLRTLLIGGVGLNAALTLLYLVYTRQTAILVHSSGGFVQFLSEIALMDLAVRSTPKGCEALGFSLMMGMRNFGLALSDVLGTLLIDKAHWSFNSLVWVNAGTTASILLLIPFLPRFIMSRREGESMKEAA